LKNQGQAETDEDLKARIYELENSDSEILKKISC
jgi:hypothetical protein